MNAIEYGKQLLEAMRPGTTRGPRFHRNRDRDLLPRWRAVQCQISRRAGDYLAEMDGYREVIESRFEVRIQPPQRSHKRREIYLEACRSTAATSMPPTLGGAMPELKHRSPS